MVIGVRVIMVRVRGGNDSFQASTSPGELLTSYSPFHPPFELFAFDIQLGKWCILQVYLGRDFDIKFTIEDTKISVSHAKLQ